MKASDSELLEYAQRLEEERARKNKSWKIVGPVRATVDLLLDQGHSAKVIAQIVREKHEVALSPTAILQYSKRRKNMGGGQKNERETSLAARRSATTTAEDEERWERARKASEKLDLMFGNK
jgi:hypothetical protein